ncbi:MAG: penicillin-binding protein, partial [Micromonosporaceae bacterium]|nr:penicillin-binding protein [Micromonosporaceae bacterium]
PVGRAAGGRAAGGRVAAPPVSPAGPVGPIRPGGAGPGGTGFGGKGSPAELARRRKKMRRRNLIIGAFAVFIILAGGVVVGGTYYYDSVKPPQELPLPEASTILYSNGKQLAKLGQENGGNREIVPLSAIPKYVQQAVISAEDRNFYKHGGVDYKGILRAAWNNLTGGETQGASTITQQYARDVAHLTGVTYARKVREAVIASKLTQKYSKDQILEFYLNTIYLGRGAYGIQAASRAYFNKTVDKLSVAEGAVLAALIKQPEPSDTFKGYDPTINPGPAKDRWNYVMDGMVEMGVISAADRAKIQYPTTVLKKAPPCVTAATCGVDTPVGNVVNYVAQELDEIGISDLRAGGYRITTTIDPKMQKAAENAARRQAKGSPMHGQPDNLMAALVAMDPRNGRVKAYYGGEKGVGTDYAGINRDPKTGNLYGGHPPGSTFKIYTMAAALKAGISTQSHWDALKLTDPDTGRKLTNAGRDDSSRVSCAKWCTLEESAIQSYNVPFYWVTKEIGPDKVVDAAKAAGIRTMWAVEGGKSVAVDLTKVSGADVAPSKFDLQVGFGQYDITVLDHANGVATLAARGIYHKAHFVLKVEKKGEDGKFKTAYAAKEKGTRVFDEPQVDDENAVLQKIPEHNNDDLNGDRPAIGKTGTWELGNNKYPGANGDAWMVGATPQLASAVWVGNVKDRLPIKDKNGRPIGGSSLPADIWKKFMNEALKGTDVERFPPAAHTGDPNRGNGVEPQHQPGQGPGGDCFLPAFFCPTDNGGNGGNDGPGGRNDGPGGRRRG